MNVFVDKVNYGMDILVLVKRNKNRKINVLANIFSGFG
jgi:hypothetical protein